MENTESIVIDIRANIKDAELKFKRLQTQMKQSLLDIKKDMNAAMQMSNKEFGGKAKKTAYIDNLKQKYKDLSLTLQQANINQSTSMNSLKKDLNANQKILDKTNLKAKQSKREFAGWAMSMMFFGMALKKLFDGIWKSSTKTFQDVMHSVEGATTQFDMMEGSLAYLGFTIGEALEPIVAYIIPIIDAMQQWAEEHPELTAGIVAIGLALGTLFMVGGMAALAINGFIDLGLKIGAAEVSASALLGTLGTLMGIAFAIKIAFDFADGKTDFSKSLDDILIAAGLILGGLGGSTVGMPLLVVGVVLKLLPQEFKDRLIMFLGGLFGIIVGAILGLVETVLSPLILIYNIIAKGYEKMTGNSMPQIDGFALSKANFERTSDLFAGAFGNEEAQSDLGGGQDYTPQFFINVELDGEELTNKVSARQLNSTNTYFTGG